jgi:hypothetical protein
VKRRQRHAAKTTQNPWIARRTAWRWNPPEMACEKPEERPLADFG